MNGKYDGAMSDDLFKGLSKEDEELFRQWARDNYNAGGEVSGLWHPVIRDECRRIDEEPMEYPFAIK